MGGVPALSWLPAYERSWLRPDAVAGLTLWGLLVPEAMAYAGIAGLPAEAGFYTLVASAAAALVLVVAALLSGSEIPFLPAMQPAAALR